MISSGENLVRGVPVDVERKPVRRINIRVSPDARVHLTVPAWRATLREGEAFLLSKWDWVARTRQAALARLARTPRAPTADEAAAFERLVAGLHETWAARLGERGVAWKLRRMKSLWGSCRLRARRVVYNTELACAPRELVEYVVVHELTHLRAADHGPLFCRLMDERLPGWRERRRALNRLAR